MAGLNWKCENAVGKMFAKNCFVLGILGLICVHVAACEGTDLRDGTRRVPAAAQHW